MITFATGCSGIGAPEVAWHDRLGWKPLWCSEIEPFPSAVLKHRWPDVPNVGDFLSVADRIARDELEAPDVFCAGTPCQAFSVAGLRNSLNDHRGGLTLEYIRIADAMDAQRKRRGLPETVFVWENVPGVFSTKDNAFGCFLGGMLGLDAPVVPAGGKWRHYGDLVAERRLAWRLLDAQYFGVAQRRRRVFVVCTARPGVRPARALFELGCVPRTAPPSREAWARTAPDAEGCPGEASWWDGGGIAESITCTSSQQRMPDKQRFQAVIDKHLCKSFDLAPAIEKEGAHELTVCFPVNSMIIGDGVKEKDTHPLGIGGESEPSFPLCAKHHHAVAAYETGPGFFQVGDVSGTLRANTSCSHAPNVVLEDGNASHWDGPEHPHPTLGAIETGVGASNQEVFAQRGSMLVYENNPTDARQKETDVSPSVLARWGTGGNQTPLVQTFSISENVIGRDPKNGGNHLGVSDGPCFTLDVAGVHGVSSTGFVRRLTTVECARLQGFPDHHTEIPWKKKRVTSVENGRKVIRYVHLPTPNGPQYKAYGNSMCVNVMKWLGRKIQGEIYANSTSKMAR